VRQPSTPPLRTDRDRRGSVRGQMGSDAQPRPMSPAELFVAQMVADLGLGDSSSAMRKRRVLQRVVDWSVAEGIPLDRELILDPEAVERFVEVGLATDRSRATYRSTLRQVGPLLTKRAPWQPLPVTVARRALAAPYTEQEEALLVADGLGQPTAERRRAARALLALGLGAGLDGRWVTRISAVDVRRSGHSVLVGVGEPAAREVVVLARWEDDIVDLARTAGTEFLVGGRSTSRNRTGHLVARLQVPTGHPPLAPARLRSSWLLRHLECGTRVPELCRAAGLQGPAVLSDLLDLVPPMPPASVQAMLRGEVL
jgi:hypothetical protein